VSNQGATPYPTRWSLCELSGRGMLAMMALVQRLIDADGVRLSAGDTSRNESGAALRAAGVA